VNVYSVGLYVDGTVQGSLKGKYKGKDANTLAQVHTPLPLTKPFNSFC
jgi:hypothetical protein